MSGQVYAFACALAYDEQDTAEIFESQDYQGMCEFLSCNQYIGLDIQAFERLVNEEQSPYYCSSQEKLDEVLKSVKALDQGLSDLFNLADQNGDKLLDMTEMYPIAQLHDQDKSAAEEEWQSICTSSDCDPQKGITYGVFVEMIIDKGGAYHVPGQEIPNFLAEARKRIPSATSSSSAPKDDGGQKDDDVLSPRSQKYMDVFKLADRNKNNLVQLPEMYQLCAKVFDYEESQEQFNAEIWEDLCTNTDSDPAKGLAYDAFAQVIGDEGSPYHVPDDQLGSFYEEVQKVLGPVSSSAVLTGQGESTPSAPKSLARKDITSLEELIGDAFEGLDTRNTGRLLSDQLFKFAQLMEYPDDERTFESDEYLQICQTCGADPKSGIDLNMFTKLVSDDQSPYHLPDVGRIRETIRQISFMNAPEPKNYNEGVAAIFQALDVNTDDLLDLSEMYRYAVLFGYEDTEQDFAEEFERICQDPRKGLTLEAFAQLVSDEESDYHVSEDDVSGALDEIRKPIQ
jgi:Ca2+-binding EF-hand superfamily protein